MLVYVWTQDVLADIRLKVYDSFQWPVGTLSLLSCLLVLPYFSIKGPS